MRLILITFLLILTSWGAFAQTTVPDSLQVVRRVVMDGDTFFVYSYHEFIFREFRSEQEQKDYLKLERRVKKVMPYAKLAAFRLQMMEDNLHQLKTKKAKKKYIKSTEAAIKEEFMGHLKSLYVEEGKLLLKLIHRETGNTTYDILKKYRGSSTTFYWGLLASFYDADIDVKYDPIVDYQIEQIIKSAKLE